MAAKRRKTWHNRLRQAAPWAAALAVVDGFFSVTSGRTDLISAIEGVLSLFLIGLALSLVGFYTIERTRFWQRFIAPPGGDGGSLDPGPDGLAPYRWSGKPPTKAVAGGLLVVGVITAVVIIVLAGSPDKTIRVILIFWVVTVTLFGATAAVGAFVLRKGQSVTIDDEGVRWEGRPRSNFDARWSEIASVEVAAFPLMIPPGGSRPRFMVLRARDGSRLGVLAPIGWMRGGEFSRLERAARSYAGRHAVPVVSVSWRSAGRGGKSRPTGTAIHPR